jgi:hypothetical protein
MILYTCTLLLVCILLILDIFIHCYIGANINLLSVFSHLYRSLNSKCLNYFWTPYLI